jgi:hypothetical protein
MKAEIGRINQILPNTETPGGFGVMMSVTRPKQYEDGLHQFFKKWNATKLSIVLY